ncbi:MAG: hypothetical protein BAJALOKI3v1_1000011 [Promethearchaeota archaeon]|nr:MAG: hypothetical protein BAJALOKI3v1_1000011 [Candidatus Lokiarchaeota archaeon]
MPKKEKEEIVSLAEFKKLNVKVKDLKKLINLNNEKHKEITDSIKQQITALDKKIDRTNEQIEAQIKTQEEIIMDMIHKFNEEFLKNKSALMAKIDDIKSQQDVLKISYSINEKKLLDKVKGLIHEEMKKCVQDNEKEILMDIWIRELKNIINDIEQLKKMDPKEFALQIDEISATIDLFKQKLK